MNIDEYLDFDKVLRGTTNRLEKSIRDWKDGLVIEEAALINRLAKHFRHRRWNCDPGISGSVRVTTVFSRLHRQGIGATDRFGSDLAVTVDIPEIQYLKTAVIQTKVSNGLEAEVQKHQIQQAISSPLTKGRAFVASFEPESEIVRIESAAHLWQSIEDVNKSRTFKCEKWSTFSDWLRNWLKCEIGEKSVQGDPNGIESALSSFAEAPLADAYVPWNATGKVQVPAEFVPPEIWVQYNLES